MGHIKLVETAEGVNLDLEGSFIHLTQLLAEAYFADEVFKHAMDLFIKNKANLTTQYIDSLREKK